MARKCFYSFYYNEDIWRVAKVKNIGAIEGQPIISANDFEEIKKKGRSAVESWISANMSGRSTLIVLIGSNTASRPWVNFEIKHAFDNGKALLGIHIHKLLDRNNMASAKGSNPFSTFTVGATKTPLSNWAKAYDPAGTDSRTAYASIEGNIERWVEEAVRLRSP